MIEVLKTEQENRIAALIEEVGAWRVVAAALRTVFRRGERPAPPGRDLPQHLRRDIGLPPVIEVPRAWEMWR